MVCLIASRLMWHTFLNVSMSIGLPFGNDTKLGQHWLNLLIIKHIAADTTHWNHVTNSGASKLTVSLLSNALFTNTVTIDVTLQNKRLIRNYYYRTILLILLNWIWTTKLWFENQSLFCTSAIQIFLYQYAATTSTMRMYFDIKFSGSSREYMLGWCCTGTVLSVYPLNFINWSYFFHGSAQAMFTFNSNYNYILPSSDFSVVFA